MLLRNILYSIKSLFKRNIGLYAMWFFVYRRNVGTKIDFFDSHTEVYVDGYPRSGNTFLIYLLRKTNKSLKVVHHMHAIAPIKLSIKRSIPCVILIREPLESIASNYLKLFAKKGIPIEVDKALINSLTDEYISYYSFVLSQIGRVNLIDFDLLITSPHLVIKRIFDSLPYTVDHQFISCVLTENIPKFKGATDPLGASLPNLSKEELKSGLKRYLMESSRIEKARAIFNEIKSGYLLF